MKKRTLALWSGVILTGMFPVSAETLWTVDSIHNRVEKAASSEDLGTIAYALADGRLLIRDIDSGATRLVAENAPYAISDVTVSASGDRVAWADYSGRVYSWTAGEEAVSNVPDGAAFRGLSLMDGGRMLIGGGSGKQAYLYNAETLALKVAPQADLEQVMAGCGDSEGTRFALGDHRGQVSLFSGSGTSWQRKGLRVSEVAIRQMAYYSSASSPLVLAIDDDNILHAVDVESQQATADLFLGEGSITGVLPDVDRGRLLVGTRDGRLLGVDVTDPASLSLETISTLEQEVVALRLHPDEGEAVIMTADGGMHTYRSGQWETLSVAPWSGAASSVAASVQSGRVLVDGDRDARVLSLASGELQPRIAAEDGRIRIPAQAMVPDAAGAQQARLYLDGDDGLLETRAASGDMLSSTRFEGWVPTYMASAAWKQRLAVMSADGALRILEPGQTGWEVTLTLESRSEFFWKDLHFDGEDAYVVQTSAGAIRVLDIAEASAVTYAMAADFRLQGALLEEADGAAVLFHGEDSLYRLNANGGVEQLLQTDGGEDILKVARHGKDGAWMLWTGDGRYHLMDGFSRMERAASFEAADPLAEVIPMGDGPFALEILESGRLELSRYEEAPLVGLFPSLHPAQSGGMTTAYFGNLRASSGSWLDHATLGWARGVGAGGLGWIWFADEGWLGIGAGMQPFMYANSTGNWLFSLLPEYDSPWVYDYAASGWRIFGQ
jgi:hypothetical protein